MAKKKFKVIEKDATIDSKYHTKTDLGDVEWHGEELETKSTTKLEQDTGNGIPIILRVFEFAVNYKTFKDHKPTAQELFNCHRKGIEAMLWSDGMSPYEGLEPRLIFSKDKKTYRFFIACIPSLGNVLNHDPRTLSQLIHK